MTTTAELIGQTLAGLGVQCAFGVVGGGNILAVAGLTGAGVRYISARHEGAAVAMADAYHRVTGRATVCTTSHGAGFTNALTALAEAARHGSGVLLLCGDAPLRGRRRHDVDQTALAASVGARVFRIVSAASAAETAAAALRAANAGGPCVLCLPNDLVTADASETASTERSALIQADLADASAEDPTAPPLAELAAVAGALARARRPLLLAGQGAWRAGAGKAIVDLGDRLGALYATTVMASGLFIGNPWSVGVMGGFATPGAAALIREADLVVAFGAGLDPFTLHHGRMLDPDATLVRIDIAAGVGPDRVDLRVRADASVAASALLDRANARPRPGAGWRESVAERVALARDQRPTYDDAGGDGRIDPRTLTRSLGELLPAERTLVLDGGQFIEWPIRSWPVPDPAGLAFMGAAFQAIGLGFAGAVGAAVGRPDRLTVAVLGDGGALMGLPELETLIRCGASALVVIYDDAAFGFEVHMYGPQGADLSSATFADTDFAALARALGGQAQTVRSPADLWTVRSWLASNRPGVLVLDCKVARNVVADFLTDLLSGPPDQPRKE